jgi:hypothetical protein
VFSWVEKVQQREGQKLDRTDNIQVIYDYYKKYQKRLDIANLEEEEESSGSKRILVLVACQNCIIVIFCGLCLPLLLSVCFWFLLLFVSSASDYSLLSLLLAWHFFLNPQIN